MSLEEKKKRPSKPKIEDGVIGEEVSIYLQDYNEPEIKVTFLKKDREIYNKQVRLFIRKDSKENSHIRFFLDWLGIDIQMYAVETVTDLYQCIQGMLVPEYNMHNHVRNFSVRELRLNPLYQVKLPHPNYEEYKKDV